MPERGKLVFITDRLALRIPRLSMRKLMHVERYLREVKRMGKSGPSARR